ncbi:hypothetical protein [Yinghuangia seranimata]|uniref:hypothetical protein n=1 Tax=Yinghuangia seranimata TaxID=408067 RepID=UPI00248CF1BE|nr:hypothetical protein [Yinghuangia seranimata]MDI2129041.1 hypothetical protein [Yinghuangia seranimata]
MDDIDPDQARTALEAAERAQRQVADEIGLPRAYWWAMAGGWLLLGVLGTVASPWLAGAATLLFGAANAALAPRLLDGRRRTSRLQVGSALASRRIPWLVVGMLATLVALTVLAALALDADGADHAGIWAGLLAAAVIGFGGPEILRVLRRWAHA